MCILASWLIYFHIVTLTEMKTLKHTHKMLWNIWWRCPELVSCFLLSPSSHLHYVESSTLEVQLIRTSKKRRFLKQKLNIVMLIQSVQSHLYESPCALGFLSRLDFVHVNLQVETKKLRLIFWGYSKPVIYSSYFCISNMSNTYKLTTSTLILVYFLHEVHLKNILEHYLSTFYKMNFKYTFSLG